VAESKAFVTRAIGAGLNIGSGHGPTHPYAHVLRWEERETVLRELGEAIGRLEREPIGHLIPEVRSNLGYALPGAMGFEDVAAIPGRITQVKDRVVTCREPAFGASRHIAKVILAAMRHDPSMRAAMNIRHEERILQACRTRGLRLATFDRGDEPRDVKEREGSSLEWGTDRAISDLGEVPDVVHDAGDVGKEPMIRILGKDPMEVVTKVIVIGKGV
jgi:hydroxymethylpyrimidine/phosphomethylpyrimidine kinase